MAAVTFSNGIGVAELVLMMVPPLMGNDLPSHQIANNGGWNVANCVARRHDPEGRHFGTIAACRIGNERATHCAGSLPAPGLSVYLNGWEAPRPCRS